MIQMSKNLSKFTELIEKKSKDQDHNISSRIIGSLLVALSGLILFSDKVTDFQLENNYGFADTQTFIWVLTQSLSPFLLVLASVFKPLKVVYTIPVYFYTIQLYWVFDSSIGFDDFIIQSYAIGTSILFVISTRALFIYKLLIDKKHEQNKAVLEETQEIIGLLKADLNN